MTVDVSPPQFVPCSEESWRSPWSMYQGLRDDDPVHRVANADPARDYWVLSRFDDVFAAARDTSTFSSAQGLTFEYDERSKAGLAERDRRRGRVDRGAGRAVASCLLTFGCANVHGTAVWSIPVSR